MVKLGLIVGSDFQGSLSKLVTCELPVLTAFKLKGIAKTIAEESEKYHKLRMDLINRFAETGEDGKVKVQENGDAVFPMGEYEKFFKEFTQLQAIEIDIPKISLKELETLKGFKAEDFLKLGDLIEGD